MAERNEKGQFVKGYSPNKGKKIPRDQVERQRKSQSYWYKTHKDEANSLHKRQQEGRNKLYTKLKSEGTYDEYQKNKGLKISKSKKGKPLTESHKQALKDAHFSKKPYGKEVFGRILATRKQLYDSGEIKPWNKSLTKETDDRIAKHPASQPHSIEWNMKARLALEIRPTKPELQFQELCKKHNLPYKYVGDGTFWLGYPPKNPDFINTTDKKQVVEIDGLYWHLIKPRIDRNNLSLTKQDIELEEQSHYQQYGFSCIIIWDDENESQILSKLR
jgi:hypothetical protein